MFCNCLQLHQPLSARRSAGVKAVAQHAKYLQRNMSNVPDLDNRRIRTPVGCRPLPAVVVQMLNEVETATGFIPHSVKGTGARAIISLCVASGARCMAMRLPRARPTVGSTPASRGVVGPKKACAKFVAQIPRNSCGALPHHLAQEAEQSMYTLPNGGAHVLGHRCSRTCLCVSLVILPATRTP